LPRRLGDDPLARARASNSVAHDSAGRGGAGTSSRASYNDVFFQRRAEESDPGVSSVPLREEAEPLAAREISEISEIPEIREVSALPDFGAIQGAAAVIEGAPAPEVVQVAEAQQVPAVIAIGGAEAAASSTTAAEPAEQADSRPVEEIRPEPEPQNGGGLLKRFFGRFGK
jgi:hypothetical protein